MAKKSKKVLTKNKSMSVPTLIVFALVFAACGYLLRLLTSAAPGYSVDANFSAVDGTWPTAVLDDPMSVALGRYNSDYGYAGQKTYGPVLKLAGTASGLKTNLTADTSVFCGQVEPIPQFEYDSVSKQWGLKSNGNELMSLKVYRLVNGTNDANLIVYGAQTSKIDRTKPMICVAQVYVASKQGTKLSTAVPVTQKFTLQPK